MLNPMPMPAALEDEVIEEVVEVEEHETELPSETIGETKLEEEPFWSKRAFC